MSDDILISRLYLEQVLTQLAIATNPIDHAWRQRLLRQGYTHLGIDRVPPHHLTEAEEDTQSWQNFGELIPEGYD